MKKIIKGFIIGVSYVMPGVCSTTTAMSLNEYQNILEIFSKFYNIKILLRNIFLIIGICLGVIFGFLLFYFLFDSFEYLILLIFLLINVKFSKIKFNDLFWIILGIIIVIILSYFIKLNNQENILMFIIGGLVVSLGLILPGLSGSLLMLNMGIYHYIMNLIRSRVFLDLKLVIFILFLLFGVLIFSRGFSNLLNNGNKKFIATIKGMQIASILVLFYSFIKAINNSFELIISFIITFVCCLLRFMVEYNR